MLAAALAERPLAPGGDPVRLADLQFARQDGTIALSRENLAAGVDLGAMPQPVRPLAPGELRGAGGYLAFELPRIGGDRLSLSLAVYAFPPAGGAAVPISALSLDYARRGDAWVLAAPPAALSS